MTDGKVQKFFKETVLLEQEILLPTTALRQDASVSVSAWLKSEAEAQGFSAVEVGDFRFVEL